MVATFAFGHATYHHIPIIHASPLDRRYQRPRLGESAHRPHTCLDIRAVETLEQHADDGNSHYYRDGRNEKI